MNPNGINTPGLIDPKTLDAEMATLPARPLERAGPANNLQQLPPNPDEVLFTDLERAAFAPIQQAMATLNNQATGAFNMLLTLRSLMPGEWTTDTEFTKAVRKKV